MIKKFWGYKYLAIFLCVIITIAWLVENYVMGIIMYLF